MKWNNDESEGEDAGKSEQLSIYAGEGKDTSMHEQLTITNDKGKGAAKCAARATRRAARATGRATRRATVTAAKARASGGQQDKQLRKRPVRAVSLERPVTRRSAPPRKATRRVQIVESASEASSSASEVETPRTARHRQWAEYRQQKNDAHQANVNRYAALFDRMLA